MTGYRLFHGCYFALPAQNYTGFSKIWLLLVLFIQNNFHFPYWRSQHLSIAQLCLHLNCNAGAQTVVMCILSKMV